MNLTARWFASRFEKAGFRSKSHPLRPFHWLLRGKTLMVKLQTGTGKPQPLACHNPEKSVQKKNYSSLGHRSKLQTRCSKSRRTLPLLVVAREWKFAQFTVVQARKQIAPQVGVCYRCREHQVVSDLIKRKALKLHDIETLILDEADEMLNMGFLEDIEAIISQSWKSSNLTFQQPCQMLSNVSVFKFMKEPEHVKIATKNWQQSWWTSTISVSRNKKNSTPWLVSMDANNQNLLSYLVVPCVDELIRLKTVASVQKALWWFGPKQTSSCPSWFLKMAILMFWLRRMWQRVVWIFRWCDPCLQLRYSTQDPGVLCSPYQCTGCW